MISKHIEADFGAVGNGVADDATAFDDFRIWAVANQGGEQIQLTWRNGATYLIVGAGTLDEFGRGLVWAQGVKDLVVLGQGATITTNDNPSRIIYFGGIGIAPDSDPVISARVNSVLKGAFSVTLKNAGLASLWSAGDWALITGFDMQGSPSYPPNPHFFEFVQVAGVSGSTVTFTAPLRHAYKDTWPLYFAGDSSGEDCGGPATLYKLHPSWNAQFTYRGPTIDQTQFQTYAMGRSVTYDGVTFTGLFGAVPTQDGVWRIVDCDLSTCLVEADKIVETVDVDNSQIDTLQFQSSSIDLLQIRNGSVIDDLQGTPKRAVFNDSIFGNCTLGTSQYGRADSAAAYNCVFSTLRGVGYGESDGGAGVNNAYSIGSGVITVPSSKWPVRWAVPGTNCFWGNTSEWGRSFRVLNVTQDASNVYAQTDWIGGFPAAPVEPGNKLYIHVHPCPLWSGTGNTGCADAVDLSQSGAQNRPLYEYTRRTYDGSVQNPALVTIRGDVVSIKVNVTTPYTGVLGTYKIQLYSKYVDSSNVAGEYSFRSVNLKIAGERVITPSGVTGNQSGDDDLSLPDTSTWLSGSLLVQFTSDISGESAGVRPSVTVEVETNQGVVQFTEESVGTDSPDRQVILPAACM